MLYQIILLDWEFFLSLLLHCKRVVIAGLVDRKLKTSIYIQANGVFQLS